MRTTSLHLPCAILAALLVAGCGPKGSADLSATPSSGPASTQKPAPAGEPQGAETGKQAAPGAAPAADGLKRATVLVDGMT
jgi:hypothetical protein